MITKIGDDYRVTRGDSFALDFTLDRDFQSTDVIIFSIKKRCGDSEFIAQKKVSNLVGNSGAIEFLSSELNLNPGIYFYDIKLKAYNGDVFTFVVAKFIITEAVEYEV